MAEERAQRLVREHPAGGRLVGAEARLELGEGRVRVAEGAQDHRALVVAYAVRQRRGQEATGRLRASARDLGHGAVRPDVRGRGSERGCTVELAERLVHAPELEERAA